LEDQGVDWKVILKMIFKEWNGARGRELALVSAVMNLRIPQNVGDFLTS
jgi:hypothetical protein